MSQDGASVEAVGNDFRQLALRKPGLHVSGGGGTLDETSIYNAKQQSNKEKDRARCKRQRQASKWAPRLVCELGPARRQRASQVLACPRKMRGGNKQDGLALTTETCTLKRAN